MYVCVYVFCFMSLGSALYLDLFACFHCLVLYLHACCIIVTRWGEPG